MDPITLLFVGLQIGVSLYNQSRNSELTARIKEEQRKAKLDEIKNNQRRDMERFQRLCQLQEEMEVAAHVHRIEKIQQDFLNTFGKMAHKENLDSHYHLNVSPYVIQRSIIPLTVSDLKNTRQELFCILTASNDETFNKNVLPYLDEAICDVISKYWNESCNHTLCYYQNLWDSESNTFSNEDVENIRSLINTPTVSVSPWFQKKGDKPNLILKISVWGVGNENSLSCEIDTGICFDNDDVLAIVNAHNRHGKRRAEMRTRRRVAERRSYISVFAPVCKSFGQLKLLYIARSCCLCDVKALVPQLFNKVVLSFDFVSCDKLKNFFLPCRFHCITLPFTN